MAVLLSHWVVTRGPYQTVLIWDFIFCHLSLNYIREVLQLISDLFNSK